MKLVKYSKAGKNNTGSSTGGSSGSSSTTEITGGSATLDREIWGKHDMGDDIDGTMTVSGDIFVKSIIPPTYEQDDDDDSGEDVEEETGGGSVHVELDVEVGRHLFINYPAHPEHPEENKKCVGEIIKTVEDNVATNKSDISSLKTRVSNNETNISNNADEIAKLKSSNLTTDDVLELIRQNQPSKLGAYDQPVVLFSGRARRVTYYSDRYYLEGIKLPCFDMSNTISDGQMTITISPFEGYKVNVYSVHCNQERSGDTDGQEGYIKGRSDGAHWFETRVDSITQTNKVYIREFHQGNGDNDTWYSDAWFESGGIKAVNITLIGYITVLT